MISGISARTFYRKMETCKAAKQKEAGYFDETTAFEIAKELGFEFSLIKYIEARSQQLVRQK